MSHAAAAADEVIVSRSARRRAYLTTTISSGLRCGQWRCRLGLHITRADHIAILDRPEIQLHARPETHSSGTSSIVMARSPRFMVEAKWYGASRCVPLW